MIPPTPTTDVAGSGAMFDTIADRYDLVNRVISFGMDRAWRRHAAARLRSPHNILDLATGTGDLAIELARQYPQARVIGLDPAQRMLEIARRKSHAAMLEHRIEFVAGDAQALPFAASTFDGISMAFGIRNVPDRTVALREIARVACPSARIGILELTEPRGLGLASLARCHVHWVVPLLGGLLSGPGQYEYLSNSIAKFPAPESFVAIANSCGLSLVELVPFCFGVCHLFLFTPSADGSV